MTTNQDQNQIKQPDQTKSQPPDQESQVRPELNDQDLEVVAGGNGFGSFWGRMTGHPS